MLLASSKHVDGIIDAKFGDGAFDGSGRSSATSAKAA